MGRSRWVTSPPLGRQPDVCLYAAFMQTEPVDPDDVYQSLAVRLIRAVNSYDPRKGYLKEYILSQLKREMVRIRSTQTVYGLTQAPANIGSTIVPLTIAAQRESYWETYIAVSPDTEPVQSGFPSHSADFPP